MSLARAGGTTAPSVFAPVPLKFSLWNHKTKGKANRFAILASDLSTHPLSSLFYLSLRQFTSLLKAPGEEIPTFPNDTIPTGDENVNTNSTDDQNHTVVDGTNYFGLPQELKGLR